MISAADIVIFLVSYLLGAVPFSVIISRVFYKTDVRQFGSGNPGATNTLRTLGPKAGLTVLLLDMLKGVVPVLLAKYFGNWPGLTAQDQMCIAGACAIAGHIFSPFLGFKGGKGVATTVGVIIALEPMMALAVIATFILVLLASKYVSLSSILAAFCFTLLTLLLRNGMVIPMIFSIAVTLLIVVKHKANIIRLIKGEENRFSLGKKKN